MTPSLHVERLTWDHCQSLAPRIAPGDAFECLANGRSPVQALAGGLLGSVAWAVVRTATGTPVGAFGYVPGAATIWSLWANLSFRESCEVLQGTPLAVAFMVHDSGYASLWNYAARVNHKALTWLRRSGCFAIEDEVTIIADTEYHRFETSL